MKHKKKSQYTKKFLRIFCVCIFLCILSFCVRKEVTEKTEEETGSKSVLEVQTAEVMEEESEEEPGREEVTEENTVTDEATEEEPETEEKSEEKSEPAEAEEEESESSEETEESGETVVKITETAGTPGEDGVVLSEVRYDESTSDDRSGHRDMYIPVQFVFSDGSVVEWQSLYAWYTPENVQCLDLTGDGVKEVLLWGYFANTAGEYNMLNIFQIHGKEVTEVSFQDDIEELRDGVCNTHLFYLNRGSKKGCALQVETFGKEGAMVFLEQRMEIYYENGKWKKLPGRNLNPQVSLESDSEEARLYEAFLRGECNAGEAVLRCLATEYFHLGYMNVSFHTILDHVMEDSIRTFQAPVVDIEDIECGLIDCVGSVEYGLMDCGDDGKPEIAVQIRGVHEYAINADCNLILIFGCRNGKVEFLYGVDTWESRHAEIYLDGTIYTDGKGGVYSGVDDERIFHAQADNDEAAYRSVECGKIGADGVYRERYEVITGMGKEVGSMTTYEPLHNEELSVDFYQCLIENKTMYAYQIHDDVPGDVLEHTLEYIEENEEKLGVQFFTYETMKALCDAQERKLGICDHDDEANKIQWQTLQGCEEYTKMT